MDYQSWAVLTVSAGMLLFPFFFKRNRPAVSDSFAVGDRSFGAFMVNCGLSSTFIGGAAILNLAAISYQYGWYVLADILPVTAALFLSAIFLVKPIRESKQVSIGAYLSASSEGHMRQVIGLLGGVLYLLIFAAQIVAITAILSTYFELSSEILAILVVGPVAIYIFRMGYFAVTLTDVLQYSLMVVGYLLFVGIGIAGWENTKIAEPITQVKMPLDMALTLALPLLFVPASQDLHVRIASAKSDRAARIGVILSAISYFAFGAIAITIGLTMARSGIGVEQTNQVVPDALNLIFAEWSLIPNLAILAVILSTMDSVFFSSVTSFKYDFLGIDDEKKNATPVALIVTFVAIVGVIIATLSPSILSIILFALTLYVSTIFPVAIGRRLRVSPRTLKLIAFAVILVVVLLEVLRVEISFKPFIYTAVHLFVILVVKSLFMKNKK